MNAREVSEGPVGKLTPLADLQSHDGGCDDSANEKRPSASRPSLTSLVGWPPPHNQTADALESLPSRDTLRTMTISHATDLWLGELERKNHAERTLDTYRRLLNKLADDYPRIDVDELTTVQIRRFLDEHAKKRGGARKAAASIAQNVTIINGFLDWLTREGVIARNPARRNGDRILSRPRQVPPDENDNVVTVSQGDVSKLLAVADSSNDWSWRLAVNVLIHIGPRRHAVATARIRDYDQTERTLTFNEKGGKTIRKPIPDELADLIDTALAAGVYEDSDAYLIPSPGPQRRPGDRDDRVIWRIIDAVRKEAGVTTHVHALRAAFAVHFLEQRPGEIVALQKLMGHRRIETTLVYLRRLNRMQAMESVRDLSWRPQNAPELLASLVGTEKEGFEPSSDDLPGVLRAGIQSALAAPAKEPV